MLTTQESGEHHQVNIHPPGIDPIKPVVIHDSSKKENDTGIHVGIREAPVDVDVAKVGTHLCLAVVNSLFLFVLSTHCQVVR